MLSADAALTQLRVEMSHHVAQLLLHSAMLLGRVDHQWQSLLRRSLASANETSC